MIEMGEKDVKVESGGQGESVGAGGGQGESGGAGGGACGGRRLELGVQRGPCWLPTPSNLALVLGEFGEIEGQVEYDQVPGWTLH